MVKIVGKMLGESKSIIAERRCFKEHWRTSNAVLIAYTPHKFIVGQGIYEASSQAA